MNNLIKRDRALFEYLRHKYGDKVLKENIQDILIRLKNKNKKKQ